MSRQLSEKTIEFLEDAPIFFQPWWLQAVSPDNWGMAIVKRGDEVAGVWPYTYKMKLGRFRIQNLPSVYSYSGPWLRKSTAKYAKRLGAEKDLITNLIGQLPDFASFHQWCHPSITNWMPLYWKGFTQTTRYTYIIDGDVNSDSVWGAMLTNIRGDVRKAEKSLEIITDNNINNFYTLLESTFKHQNMVVPISRELLIRINKQCKKNDCVKMILAVDNKNKVHAGAYLVYDEKTVYCILRGSNRELKNSGANALVVWKAIEFALSLGKSFDFCGSWNEPIERFVRGFGGQQVPFFEISKLDSKIVNYYRMVRKLI
jgi:hypothetical protein